MVGFHHFNLIDGFGIDYMHLMLIGIIPNMVDLYFCATNFQEDFYIPPVKQNIMDRYIVNMKPISEVTRKSRSILKDRKDFKAIEYKSFALYYFPVAIHGLQKEKYANHFNLISSAM